MKIDIIAIHKLASTSLESQIIANYLKRIQWNVNIKEIDSKDKFPPHKQKIHEGDLLLKSVPAGSMIIALDETGIQYSSQEFAAKLEHYVQPISFLIGGANGLSTEVKQKANFLLSLSKMTMPHILARVILVEQIYRAYSISQNHPYHK